jgi:hypothetical protein
MATASCAAAPANTRASSSSRISDPRRRSVKRAHLAGVPPDRTGPFVEPIAILSFDLYRARWPLAPICQPAARRDKPARMISRPSSSSWAPS